MTCKGARKMEKLSEKRLNILIEAASAGIYPPGVKPMNIDEKLSVLLDYKQLRTEKCKREKNASNKPQTY